MNAPRIIDRIINPDIMFPGKVVVVCGIDIGYWS